jgi:cell division septation protein DedD
MPMPSTTTPKVKAPRKLAATPPAATRQAQEGKSRYAVQVVTYSRPQSAKQELERLKARGERAFLVIREGRTIVYVGPFLSKVNASDKVAVLKAHYHDCFVKTL